MKKHQHKPQKTKAKQKKHKALVTLEHELRNSFETIYANSFDVNDESLIHAVGRISTVRNLFAKAREDDVRYIPVIRVELMQI